MYLTHIVRTFRNRLDSKLLQRHLLHDNLLQRLNGCIHRTITRSSSLELLTADIKAYRGHRLHPLSCCYLQEVETDGMSLSHISPGEHQHISIVDLLLLVCQNQELLIYLVEFFLLKVYAIHM